MEGVQMSDNILTKSTDLGVGSLTVGHLIEIRNVGKPLLTIHHDGQITVAEHLKPNEIASEVLDIMKSMNMADPQATKIRELQSDVNELKELVEYLQDEQCYGTCWGAQQRIDELTQQLNAANDRIKRLESVENIHAAVLNAIDNWIQQRKAKEAKP